MSLVWLARAPALTSGGGLGSDHSLPTADRIWTSKRLSFHRQKYRKKTRTFDGPILYENKWQIWQWPEAVVSGFELFILADHMNVMNIKTGNPERGWHSLKISRSWDAHDITFWAMDLRTERCPKHIMARSWPGPFHSFAFYGIYGTQHHAHHGHGHINVLGGRWDAGPWNWSTFPLQPALNLHCIKADVRKASRCQTKVSSLGFGEDRLTSAIVEGSANCMLTVKAQTCSTRMRPFGNLRHGCMSCNGRWGNIIYVMHVCIECIMYRM